MSIESVNRRDFAKCVAVGSTLSLSATLGTATATADQTWQLVSPHFSQGSPRKTRNTRKGIEFDR